MDEESEGGVVQDQEKKIRREIANSNERRRMQSINAGFQSLRTLLPHHEGEKLSKAAILQQTAEYIYSLEQEKTRLLAQNCQLKRLLSLSQQQSDTLQQEPLTPKRKRGQKAAAKAGSEEAQSTSAGTGTVAAATATATAASNELPTEPETSTALPLPIIEERIGSCSTEDTNNMVLLSCGKQEDSSLVLSKPVIETVDGAIRVRLEPIHTEQAVIKQEENGREDENSERSYIVTSNSKSNLNSIVEAIRHLEGDNLFAEDPNVVTHQVFCDDVVQRIALKQSDSIIIVEKHVK